MTESAVFRAVLKGPRIVATGGAARPRSGLDIAISSWWGIGDFTDDLLLSSARICKSVQWCIYYEREAYADPTVFQIITDLKWVIDRLGPTRNYARVDGKWLVFVYIATEANAATRWRQAKQIAS